MTRGIGAYHNRIHHQKKGKILDFIARNQPITENYIMKRGHFRRNSIHKYLSELLAEGKILEVQGYYVINPPQKEILEKIKVREGIKEFLKLTIEKEKGIAYLVNKVTKASIEQPIRCELVEKKMINDLQIVIAHLSNIDNYSNKADNSDQKRIMLQSTISDEEILKDQIRRFKDNAETMTQIILRAAEKLAQSGHYEDLTVISLRLTKLWPWHSRLIRDVLPEKYKRKYIFSSSTMIRKTSLQKFNEKQNLVLLSMKIFFRHFRRYPRIEFSENKDSKYKPGVINPKFLKKDRSIDYEKIEQIYNNRSKMDYCPCGCGFNMGEWIEEQNAREKVGLPIKMPDSAEYHLE